MQVYTAQAFRAALANAKTKQAATRPLTLTGSGEVVKTTLTDSEFEAWSAEQDSAKRDAILQGANRRVITTGKVQVTRSAMDGSIDPLEPRRISSAGSPFLDQ